MWIDVSKDKGITIIDVAKHLLARSVDMAFYKKIIPDGIHPNQIGHYLYASVIFQELLKNNIIK